MTGNPLLVVDDTEMNRDMLSRRLRRHEFEVEVAENGEQALAMIDRRSYDLVFLDVMMPGLSGLEVLERIRRDRSAADLPIIMATARDQGEDIVEALRLGANDYITKPIDFEVALARTRTQLALKAAFDEIRRLERSLAERNDELEQANQKMTRANERMSRDLQAAARVQQTLLPTDPPAVAEATFDWRYEPCDELAGDILDVFRLDDDHIGLFVLDVAGHGVKASLLAVQLSRFLTPFPSERNFLYRDGRPVRPSVVLDELNARFPIHPSTYQFFTMAYAVLSLRSGRVDYASGGHCESVLVRADGRTEFVRTGGRAVGIRPGSVFEGTAVDLARGDRFYLLSDGVEEAMDPAGNLFGYDRIAATLVEARPRTLAGSVEDLLAATSAWCAPGAAHDDLSILALEYHPTRSG